MFFIVNRTINTIILSDINVTLGPRQGIDLDKIMSRDKSESSACLMSSKSKGEIEVRVKDDDKNKSGNINISYKRNKNQNNISELKEEIIREVSSSLNDTVSKILSQKREGLTKEDLENSLRSIISSQSSYNLSHNEVKKDDDIDLDEDVLSEISAKTVDKMLKNTDSRHLKYKEKEEKNTIINNIDELENLLG